MTAYGFDFIGPDGTIQAIDVGEFASPHDATRQARFALGVNFSAVAVEVWSGNHRIARLRQARSQRATRSERPRPNGPAPGRLR